MPVHLVKMAVGVDDVDALRRTQAERLRVREDGAGAVVCHRTRFRPRRARDVVADGSMYWVIKGYIRARQNVDEIVSIIGDDGEAYCELRLDPTLARTEPRPVRAFRGWRYLDGRAAPPDLICDPGADQAPPEMAVELRRLGLL